MLDFVQRIFSSGGFMPHGHCYLWTPGIVWLHVVSDALITLAYYSIPITLAWFVRQRRDIDFRWMFVCFAVFILACGTTHLLEIWNVWHSNYWLSGAMKALTAAASVPTAILLTRLMPQALTLPSPSALQQVNASLLEEVAARRDAEGKLREVNAELESRVAERTAELQRQIYERAGADERALWLASFPEQTPNPIVEFDLGSGVLCYANPEATRMFPDVEKDGLGHPWLAVAREMKRRWSQDRSETARCEAVFGEACYFLTATYLADTQRVRVYGSDITERKRAEGAAAQLAAIVESSLDAIIGKDLNSIVTSWNTGAEKMFGYAASEMIGRPITLLNPPDREDEEERILARIKRGESTENFETVRMRKDGSLIDVSVTVSPIKDSTGQIIGASKAARDITDAKRAQAAVRASEARLNFALQTSRIGAWELSLHDHTAHRTPIHDRIFGYPTLLPVWTYEIFLEHVLPEDRAEVDRSFREATAAHADWNFECRIRRADGETRWLWAAGGHEQDSEGKAVRMSGIVQDITERKNTEEALREKEAQLHAADRRLAEIMHGMTEACFAVDAEWRFTFVNDRSEALFHKRREEMLGRSIWEVFPKLVGAPMEAHYRRAMAKRMPDAFEVLSTVAERWLDVRLFPTGEGIAAFLLDIHDRKRAEEALRESEERFREMANSIPQLAWIARADGFVYWYNQRWYEYTGTTPEQMEGWGWQSVHDPEALPSVMERWKGAIDSGKLFDMEFPLRGADGQFRTFLTRIQPLKDSEGRVVQWFGTNTDVEALKQAEEKVRLLNTELEQRVVERTAQLEAANKELEAFSYSVSHDLRAPLRAVDGFAQAVLEDYGPQLPEEGQRYLRTIRGGAQKMGVLIDDLLTFSRLSRAPLNKQKVDTVSLVRGVLNDLSSMQEGRRIDLRIGELPACAGDPALLKQVWINLLSNALKYTQKREAAVVEIGCERTPEGSVYFVRDNGTGFDMRYADKLFGVFQRLHLAEEFEGTGVGLAIVQRVIHRHGGRVWAEAEEDRGATFHFTLGEETKL